MSDTLTDVIRVFNISLAYTKGSLSSRISPSNKLLQVTFQPRYNSLERIDAAYKPVALQSLLTCTHNP